MRNPEGRNREREKVEQFGDILHENFSRAKEEREEIIGTSVEILRTGDEDARWMAVGVLAETGDEKIVQPLIESLLSDRSPRVRAEAVRVLGDCRDLEKTFAALVEALNDTSEVVRDKAFEALHGITVLEKEPGKYESPDREFCVHVEEPDDETTASFTFFIRKNRKMQRLRQKAFVLLGPDGYIEGMTDSRGCALLSNKKLRESGCGKGAGNIRFVLR